MRPWKKVAFGAVVGLVFLGMLFLLLNPSPYYMRRHFDEHRGFNELHMVALEMLSDEAPGVVHGKDGQPYIESFQSFFDYVKAKHPSWIAGPGDSNPFPGVLPEAGYGKLDRKAVSGDDWIIWSETKHPMQLREMQFRLLANGLVDQ